MKAAIIRKYGDPSVFEISEVPTPSLRENSLLLRVKATSVNPIDTKLRGQALPFAQELPTILHGDVAGVVESVGAGVSAFKKGDEVYGCAGGVRGTFGGALAEYMLVDPQLVAKKPSNLSFRDAAALPLVILTAWEALVDKTQVRAGERVLIHGGVGGVGHVSVQLAKWLGAIVYTTIGSDEQGELAKSLGADVLINYRQESLEKYVAKYTDSIGFDVVFDTVGGENLGNSLQAARNNGRIACINPSGDHDLTSMFLGAKSLHSILMLLPMLTNQGRAHHGEILAKVAQLVELKKLRPLVDQKVFKLADAAAAHALLESGKAVGKVVVEI